MDTNWGVGEVDGARGVGKVRTPGDDESGRMAAVHEADTATVGRSAAGEQCATRSPETISDVVADRGEWPAHSGPGFGRVGRDG